MFAHNKRLQYTVRVNECNPGLANLMLEQFGGPQGELAAAMRYFNQYLAEDDAGRRDIGVVVDGVSDVIDVAAADIKPAPQLGEQVNTEFIEGLAAVSGRMVMLLDIDKLIGGDVAGAAPLPVAANS